MKLAIMQPYFFPYIGYFQLMRAVDEFVIYDNIKYTKKGWINRNRILVNTKTEYITLPVKKDSDTLSINQRFIADSWLIEKSKLLNKIKEAYRKSPYFKDIFPLLEDCLNFSDNNLFSFLYNSLIKIKNYINITTPLVISSTIPNIGNYKAEQKVIEICKARNSTVYINPIGGIELYDVDEFGNNGIELYFLKSKEFKYQQYTMDFTPWLSIIDILMFNSPSDIMKIMDQFVLIKEKYKIQDMVE